MLLNRCRSETFHTFHQETDSSAAARPLSDATDRRPLHYLQNCKDQNWSSAHHWRSLQQLSTINNADVNIPCDLEQAAIMRINEMKECAEKESVLGKQMDRGVLQTEQVVKTVQLSHSSTIQKKDEEAVENCNKNTIPNNQVKNYCKQFVPKPVHSKSVSKRNNRSRTTENFGEVHLARKLYGNGMDRHRGGSTFGTKVSRGTQTSVKQHTETKAMRQHREITAFIAKTYAMDDSHLVGKHDINQTDQLNNNNAAGFVQQRQIPLLENQLKDNRLLASKVENCPQKCSHCKHDFNVQVDVLVTCDQGHRVQKEFASRHIKRFCNLPAIAEHSPPRDEVHCLNNNESPLTCNIREVPNLGVRVLETKVSPFRATTGLFVEQNDAVGSLLDSMHRRCYPNQYRRGNRHTKSDESLNSDDDVRQSNDSVTSFDKKCDASPTAEHDAKSNGTVDCQRKENLALDSCSWLRAAGFPQYAQLYEQNQFPVELAAAKVDHMFLDKDSLQSLFRRLEILNSCATGEVSSSALDNLRESDEEENFALSDQWRFHKSLRRWSRKETPDSSTAAFQHSAVTATTSLPHNCTLRTTNEATTENKTTEQTTYLSAERKSQSDSTLPQTASPTRGYDVCSPTAKRSASEKLWSALEFFSRLDLSRLSKRKKDRHARQSEISSPVLIESPSVAARLDRMGCTDVLSNNPECIESTHKDEEARQSSPALQTLPITDATIEDPFGINKALLDLGFQPELDDANCNVNHSGSFPKLLTKNDSAAVDDVVRQPEIKRQKTSRSERPFCQLNASRTDCRRSIYDNVPSETGDPQMMLDNILDELYTNISGLTESLTGDESSGSDNKNVCDAMKTEETAVVDDFDTEAANTQVASDGSRRRLRWHSFVKAHRSLFSTSMHNLNTLSAGELVVLKQLCSLRSTALQEKYVPVNRSGRHWQIPNFMKRLKTPDYRERRIFGVPLLVTLRRTGQPLPQEILHAMRSLRKTAASAVGIFRKTGMRKRIEKLRSQLESDPAIVDFDDQPAYDVADLLKQFFRELPECLLTTKLSETLINIYTYLPEEKRMEALKSALVLLPDENSATLQCLLCFLNDIAKHAEENKMTVFNLSVCFTPALFHLGKRSKDGSRSPNFARRKTCQNVFDLKELQDQKAAHECLNSMITNAQSLFMVDNDLLSTCSLSYKEPEFPLLDLTKLHDSIETYMDVTLQAMLKEAIEKYKGWVNVSVQGNHWYGVYDLAYKKINDGHPLRIWKCATEIQAPPEEVLNRILMERHLWDDDLLKWRQIERLGPDTEVYQYVQSSMAPLPTRDFCELRSWRTDLTRGACALISTSVDHPKATLLGGVRALTFASRYFIEPCGGGCTRLTHLSRADYRGFAPEYYNSSHGHLMVHHVRRIKETFSRATQNADGPETKV